MATITLCSTTLPPCSCSSQTCQFLLLLLLISVHGFSKLFAYLYENGTSNLISKTQTWTTISAIYVLQLSVRLIRHAEVLFHVQCQFSHHAALPSQNIRSCYDAQHLDAGGSCWHTRMHCQARSGSSFTGQNVIRDISILLADYGLVFARYCNARG